MGGTFFPLLDVSKRNFFSGVCVCGGGGGEVSARAPSAPHCIRACTPSADRDVKQLV